MWQTPAWKDRLALVSDRLRQRRFFRNLTPPAYSVTIGLEGKLAEIVRGVAAAGERANARYSPLRYDGHVLLVRANRPTHWSGMRFDDPLNGWGPVIVGKIDVVGIDCDHSELADKPLPEVGRAVQRALDRASKSSNDQNDADSRRVAL